MYFQFRNDAEKWFQGIEKYFEVKFDLYYFCFIAGIASGRKVSPKSSDVTDLVENFPGPFKSSARLIIGLFLRAELLSLGINMEDRLSVNKTILEYIDPDSPSNLSDKGIRLMNQYSHGGFDALREHFDDRPRHLDTFFRKFTKCIEELRKQNT